jgi:hypothetical protein
MCTILYGQHGVSKNRSGITAADVTRVCEAAAMVLRDLRSDPLTNNWCYYLAYNLGKRTQWVDIVSQIMLEPIRDVALRGQVEYIPHSISVLVTSISESTSSSVLLLRVPVCTLFIRL